MQRDTILLKCLRKFNDRHLDLVNRYVLSFTDEQGYAPFVSGAEMAYAYGPPE